MAPSCLCVNTSVLNPFMEHLNRLRHPIRAFPAKLTEHFPNPFRHSTHIFKNGIIRTMQGGDADITVSALAISGDTIVATGSLDDCRKKLPGANEIDLKGKCILPGLIEPHVHMLPTSIYDMWVQLGPFNGQDLVGNSYVVDWVYDTLSKALAAGEERNGWLVGFGVDPSMFADMRPGKDWMDPTAEELDSKVSKTTKIFIMNSSGHVGYANTAALKAANSPNTSGILTEHEMVPVMVEAVKGYAGSPTYFFEVVHSMFRMFKEAAAVGVTTLFDAALGATGHKAELEFFDKMAHLPTFPLRIGGGLVIVSEEQYDTWKNTHGVTPQSYRGAHFNVPNIKIVSDGSNQGLTGYQLEPYPHPNPIVNDGHENGIWNLDDMDYKKLMTNTVSDGWTLMIHANGDAAIEKILDGYKAVADATGDAPLTKRHRIEHCSILTDEYLERMAALGISPSFLIGHVGYWGRTMVENVFGLRKAELLDRTASAERCGLRYTLHSDHFVSPFGPLRMAEQAVLRDMEAVDGYVPLNKDECVDIRSALRAITYDAAWQISMDEWIGQLMPGMKADLVVLAEDPVAMKSVKGLRHVKVCQTWMGGRRTHHTE